MELYNDIRSVKNLLYLLIAASLTFISCSDETTETPLIPENIEPTFFVFRSLFYTNGINPDRRLNIKAGDRVLQGDAFIDYHWNESKHIEVLDSVWVVIDGKGPLADVQFAIEISEANRNRIDTVRGTYAEFMLYK